MSVPADRTWMFCSSVFTFGPSTGFGVPGGFPEIKTSGRFMRAGPFRRHDFMSRRQLGKLGSLLRLDEDFALDDFADRRRQAQTIFELLPLRFELILQFDEPW